jgi:hypothetical protein
MVIADVWAAVGGVVSVLAAASAAVAIWFAKTTVDEARASRKEDQQAHEQVLASHRAQLDASSAAHREEMAQRAEALAAERQLDVVRRLDGIADALLNLADCAREETISPPARLTDASPIPLTCIPGLLAALRAAAGSLHAIGGPELPNVSRIAAEGYGVGTPPIHFVGEAFTGLQEVEAAIAAHVLGPETPR